MGNKTEEQKLNGYRRMKKARTILAPVVIILSVICSICTWITSITEGNQYVDTDPGVFYTDALEEVLHVSIPGNVAITKIKGGSTGFSSSDYAVWVYSNYSTEQWHMSTGRRFASEDEGEVISCTDIKGIGGKVNGSCLCIRGTECINLFGLIREKGHKLHNPVLYRIAIPLEFFGGIFIAVFPIGHILCDRAEHRAARPEDESPFSNLSV